MIGECDGALKYGDQASIVAEKEREQDLSTSTIGWSAGWARSR